LKFAGQKCLSIKNPQILDSKHGIQLAFKYVTFSHYPDAFVFKHLIVEYWSYNYCWLYYCSTALQTVLLCWLYDLIILNVYCAPAVFSLT